MRFSLCFFFGAAIIVPSALALRSADSSCDTDDTGRCRQPMGSLREFLALVGLEFGGVVMLAAIAYGCYCFKPSIFYEPKLTALPPSIQNDIQSFSQKYQGDIQLSSKLTDIEELFLKPLSVMLQDRIRALSNRYHYETTSQHSVSVPSLTTSASSSSCRDNQYNHAYNDQLEKISIPLLGEPNNNGQKGTVSSVHSFLSSSVASFYSSSMSSSSSEPTHTSIQLDDAVVVPATERVADNDEKESKMMKNDG